MIFVESTRYHSEFLATQLKVFTEMLVITSPFPFGRFINNRSTNLRQRVRCRAPKANTQKTFVRSNVHVVTGRVNVSAVFVSKFNSNIRFLRCFILRKPCIAVDPHQGTTHQPIIGHEVLGYFAEPRSECAIKVKHGFRNSRS